MSHRLLGFLLLGCLLVASVWGLARASAQQHFRSADGQTSTALPALGTFLKADGTLDLTRGFNGSLSTQGYRMEYAANGAPRFVPAAPTVGEVWDPQFVNANGGHTFGYAVAVIGTDVYLGGAPLWTAGNVTVNGIAKWNGSAWSALDSGVNGSVYALAVSGTDLYVGGSFTTAGGLTVNNIAKWNGSAWSALGTGLTGDYVLALAVSGSDLYVGGGFTAAGGTPASNIAKWNGSTWSALGSGTNQRVVALAVSGSNVYAGGEFTTAGGNPANYIAHWNGTTWSALSSGMDFFVQSLAVSGTDVFAGGSFTTAGGVPASGIAKWNGSTWSALGSGLLDASSNVPNVRALLVIGTKLYAAGTIATAGGVAVNGIAEWNGSVWAALGGGLVKTRTDLSDNVLSLAALGTDVYAAGNFTNAGGAEANRIAKWNGSSWSALGTSSNSVNAAIAAVAVSGNDVYVGGLFDFAGGIAANGIAKWNGSAWSALGSGLNGPVRALVVNGTDLYVGGQFTTAGGVAANSVAKWNGSAWSALGSGITGGVNALAFAGGNLYAGGSFFTAGGNAASNIARWNGTTWSALGSGVNSELFALAVSGSDLYAGGAFSSPGAKIAKWNGSAWSALGTGINGVAVFALAASGTDVYAGGLIGQAGGNPALGLAKWNGSTWSALGSGLNGYVFSLLLTGNDLYVGGNFDTAGGNPAYGLAKWNGSAWTSLVTTSGTNGFFNGLALQGTSLFVGGSFTAIGSTLSHYFGRYGCAVTLAPTTLPNGAVSTPYNQTLTASPAGSYSFSIISGSLPKGLTLSSAGVLSGTPTEFGLFNFTVMANGGSCMGSRAYTLAVTGTSCTTPSFTSRADFSVGGNPQSSVTADFNRDGKLDLAVSNLDSNNLTIFLGNGTGGFPSSSTVTASGMNGPVGVAVGDFNGDGNADLVVTLRNSSNAIVLWGDGNGGFPTSTSVSIGSIQAGVRVGDFNADGKLDFLVAHGNTFNQISVRLGDGVGGFSTAPGSPWVLSFTPKGILVRDFNQDGQLDLALGNDTASQVGLFFGTGTGAFTTGTPLNLPNSPTDIAGADFNLDGNFDLAVAQSDDSLAVLFGNGAGSFSLAPGSPISGAAASIPTDFNGDGRPDLAAVNRVVFGNGSGGFSILNSLNTGSARRGPVVGDWNGDGKPDLAVLNGPNNNRLVVLFNNCAPSIVAGTALTRQQGSPATNSVIATVNDPELAAGSLTVTTVSPPTGLTFTNIVNTNGTITADVAASCTISTGAKNVTLQVSDGALTATTTLTVNVTANTAPNVTYANVSMSVGAATTNPTVTAADNGSISGYTLQSPGTYTGTISVNNSTGVVSISNPAPVGSHTITIRTTDNCGATADATFTLTVGCLSTLTVVNHPGDDADATPGNGVCETAAGNGVCTLRAALQEANALTSCTPFTINFNITGTINTTSALPNIVHQNLTLNGPGADQLTVRGAGTHQLFRASGTANLMLQISGLTLTNGFASTAVNASAIEFNSVGGILTLTGVALVGNTGADGAPNTRGQIYSNLSGGIIINNSTISGDPVGNGITVDRTPLTVTNSTIHGNAQYGILSATTDLSITITLLNDTVVNNRIGVGYIFLGTIGGERLVLKNSIIANNTGSVQIGTATAATIVSQGNNLVSDGSLTPTAAGDLININPVLAPLGNYGGPTPTVALLPGSPAINAGTASGAPGTDQRGIARVGNVDIGAFESRGFTQALMSGDKQSAPVNSAFANPLTVTLSSAFNEPVNGGRVSFTAPASGASAALVGNPATLANGQAAVTATANASTGTYQVTATANGGASSTSFTLTNICPSITVTAPATNTGTVGAPFSQTFTQAGGIGATTFSVVSGTLPSGLTLAANGNLSGTPMQTGTFNLTVSATDANGCQGTSATYTLTINCQALTVNPANATLPGGRAGTPYSQSFTAAGNLSAVSFTVSAGSLPTGLTLSSGGALTGTPSVFGTFSFTVRATEANGCFGERAYSLTLLPPCGTLTLNPASLANGFQTRAYNQTLTATGGTAPYTFAVTSGSLPGGLTLASGGALTGTPTASGTFTFTVTTTDDTGCTGTRSYTVIVSGDGLQFFPLAAPVRLLDTRTGATACTQPNAPVAGQTSLTQVGRNFCGIPANAVALTGNVSTINSGGGFLTLYPSDAAQPTVANSTYGVNEVITNVFTVGLGAGDGAFKIFAFNTTDVAVDVTGYYAPPAPNGLYFHPLPTPVRLLDTRAGATGCVTPGAPLPGNTDTPQQAITTCSGIPAAARALVGNATTVSPQGFGYLTLFPGDANRPLVASSTYSPGQTVNGPFTVGLAPNGEFKVFTFAATDLAIDVVGYYSTEVSDVNGAGLLFAPLPQPVRLLETRNLPVGCFKPNAPLTGQQEYTQSVRGTCDGVTIPSTALAAVGNATAVTPNGFGFLTLWPSGAARPLVATATYSPSEVTNRHFIVGLGASDGAFKMYTFATSHLVIDLSGYFAP